MCDPNYLVALISNRERERESSDIDFADSEKLPLSYPWKFSKNVGMKITSFLKRMKVSSREHACICLFMVFHAKRYHTRRMVVRHFLPRRVEVVPCQEGFSATGNRTPETNFLTQLELHGIGRVARKRIGLTAHHCTYINWSLKKHGNKEIVSPRGSRTVNPSSN